MPPYHTTIGHAHIKVRDLQCSIAFYTRFFDLHVVEQFGAQYAFLTGGALHHELALQQIGANAPLPISHGVGLYHLAFEVPDRRSFAQAFTALRTAGVEVGTVDHRISWAMYFADPDGNGLEIYWDTRSQPPGHTLWHGENAPLPAQVIMAALEDEHGDQTPTQP